MYDRKNIQTFETYRAVKSELVVFYGRVDFEVDITRKIDNDKSMTKYDVLKEKLYTYTIDSYRLQNHQKA
uniref:Uncharacterized protein n=1 Tax=Romanomermis culicivorax TaxID=13658 RepID=A0A915K8I1_ROMCU